MSEVLLGVCQFPQPIPKRNPGGDCFACSLKAAIDFLYPENPVPFDTAWEAFQVPSFHGGSEGTSKTMVLSNNWHTMAWSAPHSLDDHPVEVHRDIIHPNINLDHWSHSWGFQVNDQEWAKRLEAWLSAGWVALAECSLEEQPAVDANGRRSWTDHFIVLDGQRSFWQKSKDGRSSRLCHETHVVCSARGSYWISTEKLLNMRGVNALVLIRRRNYETRTYTE